MQSTDSLLTMLSSIGDGLADVMTHALDFISLDVEQGLRMYATVLKVSAISFVLSLAAAAALASFIEFWGAIAE